MYAQLLVVQASSSDSTHSHQLNLAPLNQAETLINVPLVACTVLVVVIIVVIIWIRFIVLECAHTLRSVSMGDGERDGCPTQVMPVCRTERCRVIGCKSQH